MEASTAIRSSAIAEETDVSTETGSLTADARTVAIWTLVSRISGFGRVVVVAAVLGPTFFGNLFQTVLLIPYVVCELMARSMMPALLGPPMVQSLDQRDAPAAQALATGFLGVVLPVFTGIALLGALAAFPILWLVTIAVTDPAVRAQQISLGQPLLIALMPQVVLYGIAGIGIAVQHAHRRFALATAAPSLENFGMMAVMGANAIVFGIGIDVHHVSTGQALMLGLGSTATVALHAAAQWWGAYRLGVRLIPTAGWHDARVRQIFRMLVPSSASAGLNSLGWLAMTVASGQIAGGAVAFQIGQTFFNLPNSLCAWPIAFAQLPRLSRQFHRAALAQFHTTYRESLRLALFVAIPGGLLFFGIPQVLAGAVSFGEMRGPGAISLVAAVLTGLSIGIVGEAVFIISTTAAYARLDAASTLQAMALRVVISVAGIPLALSAGTPTRALLCLGLGYSAAVVTASIYLRVRLSGVLPKLSEGLGKWLLTNATVAAAATAPAMLVASTIDLTTMGFVQRIIGAVFLVSISGVLYFLLQFARHSSELNNLFSLKGIGPRTEQPPPGDGLPE
jgi:putative peptidoglycan lipid II flippase